MTDDASVSTIAVTAAVGAVVLLFVLICNILKKDKKSEEKEEFTETQTSTKAETNSKSNKSVKGKRETRPTFTHPWLACSLKGHGSSVVSFDFSPNGKYLVSAAEDRSILLWSVKEFKLRDHKSIRGNVKLDSVTKIVFSPDSKALAASLGNGNSIRIFRLEKKEDGPGVSIQGAANFKQHHDAEIINIGVASNGKFIMSSHRDTTIIIYNIKGDVLSRINTLQVANYFAAVSPCGRFVGSSGFTPDVKIWEVLFDKSGTFQDVKRAFELKGHQAGVHSFSFSNDSSRMASISKDGTWKFWDTDVQYKFDQDPRLLFSGKVSEPGLQFISLSPDGRSVAMGGDTTLVLSSTVKDSGQEETVFKNVHTDSITQVGFDLDNKYLVSIGDKHIHVFNNVLGYRSTITDLVEKERKATTESMKERIKKQINDARWALSEIIGSKNGSTT